MSLIIPISNLISPGNSTSALLGSGATFTGVWESTESFTTAAVTILGSMVTDGVLWVDVRKIGATIFNSVPFSKTDITSNPANVPATWSFVESEIRIRYINGTTAQTGDFYIETKYSNGQPISLAASIGGFVDNNTPGVVVRSVSVSRQPSGTFKNDPHNGVAFSTDSNLSIGAVYTSDWIDTDGYNVIEAFINTDVISAINGVCFEFTDDLSGTPTVQASEEFSFGANELANGFDSLFVYPKLVGFRIKYTNGAIAQTNFLLQVDLKTNGDVVNQLDATITGKEDATLTRSIIAGEVLDGNLHPTGVYENVSILSNKALKVALPPSILYSKSRPTDAAIPTGAVPAIDLVLNADANVLDSGWMPTGSYGGGSLVNVITDVDLDVYLMNSSDEFGNNIVGNTAPTMSPLGGGFATLGAAFFDNYFRILVINSSGASANAYSVKVNGQQTPPAPVFTSLDQPVFGSYPAPLNRSVLTGQDSEGLFKNVNITRNGDLANAITDADLGFHAIVTPGGSLKVSEQTHLVGEAFGGAALNTTKWNVDSTGTGSQDATIPGELTMDTGVTANSTVEIDSHDVARFIPANYNITHHAITIPDGASYAADNSRKWGAFDATNNSTANGVYFEIDDGIWYVAHCINGVTIRHDQTTWNGVGASTFPTNSISANVYEIEYNAGSIVSRVNGNVIHRETLLSNPFANAIHFPVGMSNTNYNGSTTDVSLKVRAAAIYTLGKGKGSDRPIFISGTTAGQLIKTGPGHLGRVVFARSGGGGGSAVISIYDGLSAVNQVAQIVTSKDDTEPTEFDFTFNIGLFVVITGVGTLSTTITFD